MASRIPAMLVAERSGNVVSQNASARQLIGPAKGKPCWEAMGALERAEGLPCRRNCVADLLDSGAERLQHCRPKLDGQRHILTCVAVDGAVVVVLNHAADQPPGRWQLLTAREREVLQLLSEGETTPRMAARLGLSESTVRTHTERMREKLGVSTRAGLVAQGFRLGFLD